MRSGRVHEDSRMRRNNGYTLLELLAALAITGMVVSAMGGLLLNGQRASQRLDFRSEYQESARVGLEMMARDIKSCRSLDVVSTNQFSLIGSDGSKVSYWVTSGTLYRSAKGATNPVVNGVLDLAICEALPDLFEVSLTSGNKEFSYQLTTRARVVTVWG
jgi:prepilin-type N-terminal cleavage/methylation domain-containing protein